MIFKYLSLIYLNTLMIIFLYFNIPLLLIFIFLIRSAYVVWKLSFEQFNFFVIDNDIDEELHLYLDYDTNSNFYFKLLKSEYYLWYNCYFFFNYNGGETIISDLDFLDIIVYNTFDLRNLKYSYKDFFYKNKNQYEFIYKFNNTYVKKYNLKYNLNLLNKDTYNILSNLDNLERFNNKKIYYYIKNENKR